MSGMVSVAVFDFLLFFCFCYFSGIESSSSWFQPKLFHVWVEDPGFHILRNAWPEIRNRAEKGCLNGVLCKNYLIQKSLSSHVDHSKPFHITMSAFAHSQMHSFVHWWYCIDYTTIHTAVLCCHTFDWSIKRKSSCTLWPLFNYKRYNNANLNL